MSTKPKGPAIAPVSDMKKLHALMNLAENNAKFIADGHLTLMRFTTGWKAFYSTPQIERGDPGEHEGGWNSISALPTHAYLKDALHDLLAHPVDIFEKRKQYYREELEHLGYSTGPEKSTDIILGPNHCGLGHAHSAGKCRPVKKKKKGIVIRAASCEIKHDHNIGLCKVPERKKRKANRKKKRYHGMGAIYKVPGCQNWFLKFSVNGKQCYMRTGTSDKRQARTILREERVKETGLQRAAAAA